VNLIDVVCEIRWPPVCNHVPSCDRAAILFKARDKLNELAAPATGLTIAYTLLVSAGESGRAELAKRAYPEIMDSAVRFRCFMDRLGMWLLLSVVVVVGLLSWSVAYGKIVLQRIEQLDAQRTEIAAALDAASQGSSGVSPSAFDRDAASDVWLQDEQNLIERCAGLARDRPEIRNAPAVSRACAAAGKLAEKRSAAEHELDAWTTPYLGLWAIPDVIDWLQGSPVVVIRAERNRQWSPHLLTILGNYVLPMFYGFLGATAAVMMNVNRKIQQSQLSPREFRMIRLKLVLSVITGACIGLFLTPSGSGASGAPRSGTTVALSASALSFLAGFGMEGVMKMLENILITAFGGRPPAEPLRSELPR
jgi:hypothetical protein